MNEKDDEGDDGDGQGDGQGGDGFSQIGDGGFQILHTGGQRGVLLLGGLQHLALQLEDRFYILQIGAEFLGLFLVSFLPLWCGRFGSEAL